MTDCVKPMFSRRLFEAWRLLFLTTVFLAVSWRCVNASGNNHESFNNTLLDETIKKKPVTGLVKNNQANPLLGVTVRIKGTTEVALTDAKGQYTINVPNDDAVLVFTYLGLENLEQRVGNSSVINVTLYPSGNRLDDVVVVGYGTVKRGDLTGSVGSADVESLKQAPVMSFEEALAGRVAGVTATSNEGMPGGGMNVVIRGANSLTQDNSPLYVIDGFPMENPNSYTLNTEDIESIDVLKDASATAIYGARGANGVIVIQTKKATSSTPKLTFNASYGQQNVLRKMDMMTPYEFLQYQYDRYEFNTNLVYLQPYNRTLEHYKDYKGIDWQSKILRTAPYQSYGLELTNASSKTKYLISGSVSEQQGVMLNTGIKRANGRVSIDEEINKKLKVGINVNYGASITTGAGPGSVQRSLRNKVMHRVWAFRPLTASGEIDLEEEFVDPEISTGSPIVNPLITQRNEYLKRGSNVLSANTFLDYDVMKSLKLRITGGINHIMAYSEEFNNRSSLKGTPLLPQNVRGINAEMGNSKNTSWLNENTLTWKSSFSKKHSFEALGGFTLQAERSANSRYAVQNIPNEQLGISGIDQGDPYQSWTGLGDNTLVSVLGRLNYNFGRKILVTSTFRADGSSKLAPGNRWSYFPSAAVAYQLGQEKFMKAVPFVSSAKLRMSYGVTGNNRVGDFSYLSIIDFPLRNRYSFFNQIPSKSAVPTALGDSGLKWETTGQWDAGLDLGLWKGRISLNLDVYRKDTYDLLMLADMPLTIGFTQAYKNIGKIRNSGLELTLNSVNIRKNDFSWRSSFNISFNRSKVLELTEGQQYLPANVTWESGYGEPLYVSEVGKEPGMFFGYVYDGMYQLDDFVVDNVSGNLVLKPGIPDNSDARHLIEPGNSKYKDLNGDGKITSADRTVIGKGIPVHVGGFNNSINYKRFTFSALLQWSYGNNIYNANRLVFEQNVNNYVGTNLYASANDRWTMQNQTGKIPTERGATQFGKYTSRVIEDGSYLRLKTLSIGYSIPPQKLSALKMSSMTVSLLGQNLLTWTNYSGMDPEVAVNYSVLTPGFDHAAYPRSRTFALRLSASF